MSPRREVTDNPQDVGIIHGAEVGEEPPGCRWRNDGNAGIGIRAAAKMRDLRHQRRSMPVIERGQLGKTDDVIDDQLVSTG